MHVLLWIDRAFSKGLTLLLLFIFFSTIFFLGIASILCVYVEFFEYEDSLWDLSNAEIGYLLLFAAVIYRHVSYCRKYKIGIWTTITRPFFALGYLMLVSLAYFGVAVLAALYTGESNLSTELSGVLSGASGAEQLVGFILTVLAIYLATPTSEQKDIISEQAPESPTDSDSNIFTEQNYQEEKSI